MLENIFKTLKTEAYVAHLEGGLRAISNPGSPVEIVPHLIDKASVNIDISSSYYKDIDFIDELKKLNLSILGLDYYNNIESIGQMYPPNWRTLSQINNLDNPIKLWDNLCIEGHTKQDYYLVDISSRISFGFKACETRLRDLSECYFRELYSQCQYRDFKNGRKFRSSNTFNIYLALHSFLVESCLVRDYLAEFMHVYIFNKYGKNPITTMGSLIKYVLKKLNNYDDFSLEIINITNVELAASWLAELGEYRDLVIHSTPIDQVESSSFIVQKIININENQGVPSIELPLPKNPHHIFKRRRKIIESICKGINSSFEEWFVEVPENTDTSETVIDALKYCSFAHEKLIEFAIKVFNKHKELIEISD